MQQSAEKRAAMVDAVKNAVQSWVENIHTEIESAVESTLNDAISSISAEVANDVAEEMRRWVKREMNNSDDSTYFSQELEEAVREYANTHAPADNGIEYSPSTWSPSSPIVNSTSALIDMVEYTIQKDIDIFTLVKRIEELRGVIVWLKNKQQ